MTPLEILGLSEGASAQEIELRWRELRSELHPDKGGDADRFHQAAEAYAQALTEAQAPKPCPTCGGHKTIGIVRGFNTIKVCCSYCGGTGGGDPLPPARLPRQVHQRQGDQMKPMLAAPVDDLSRLRYPLLASPKLDGIRCVVFGGVAMSRSMKPIPNKHVQRLLSAQPSWEGLDGELIVGPPTAKDCFQRTSSGVMSVDGEPEVIYHVFDKWQHRISDKCDPFNHRLMLASKVIAGHKHAVLVRHVNLLNEAALLHYEAEKLAAGYEGVMLRDPAGEYKAGRSTLREGGLLKLKRFEDSEAEVLGFEPLMHNANEAVRNELGHLERSSHQAGKVALKQLGSLKCRDLKTKVEFDLGTGFTSGQRVDLWVGRAKLKGKLVKYKFQPTGVKDKPRFPVFIGFRDARDL